MKVTGAPVLAGASRQVRVGVFMGCWALVLRSGCASVWVPVPRPEGRCRRTWFCSPCLLQGLGAAVPHTKAHWWWVARSMVQMLRGAAAPAGPSVPVVQLAQVPAGTVPAEPRGSLPRACCEPVPPRGSAPARELLGPDRHTARPPGHHAGPRPGPGLLRSGVLTAVWLWASCQPSPAASSLVDLLSGVHLLTGSLERRARNTCLAWISRKGSGRLPRPGPRPPKSPRSGGCRRAPSARPWGSVCGGMARHL